jgi:hypothetical protein
MDWISRVARIEPAGHLGYLTDSDRRRMQSKSGRTGGEGGWLVGSRRRRGQRNAWTIKDGERIYGEIRVQTGDKSEKRKVTVKTPFCSQFFLFQLQIFLTAISNKLTVKK